MKKEILRVNNLNYNGASARKLQNISFCVLEGECIGFAGLTYSGKNLLARFLCGDIEENISSQKIYICGKRVLNRTRLKEEVYRVAASNYVIDDWSVAEYIGLVSAGWLRMIWQRRALEEKTAAYFDELEIPFDVSRKMRELSELEKRIVDLVKAKIHGARVVLIEDEFEGMRAESIQKFRNIMKRLIMDGMAVIVNTNSDNVLSILSDKYIIFKKGRIVKKCKKEYIKSSEHMERFLLDSNTMTVERERDSYIEGPHALPEKVYRVHGLKMKNGEHRELDFEKGEVVSLLVLDSKEKERIFMLLSGRKEEESTKCILENNQISNVDFSEYVRQKIVSVMHMGSEEEIFAGMSVGENLLLPSLRKISALEYIASSGKISRMLEENIDESALNTDIAAGNLEINEIISITLERWYIYNPKVLLLLEPFAQCDVYGVSIVKDYVKKFAVRGTSVVIIKSREEYVEDISDRIINLD